MYCSIDMGSGVRKQKRMIARLIIVFDGFGQLASRFKKRFSDGDNLHNFKSSKQRRAARRLANDAQILA